MNKLIPSTSPHQTPLSLTTEQIRKIEQHPKMGVNALAKRLGISPYWVIKYRNLKLTR